MNELVERLRRIRDACRRVDGTMIPLGLELQDAITALEAADRMAEQALHVATGYKTGKFDIGASVDVLLEALTAYRTATKKKD